MTRPNQIPLRAPLTHQEIDAACYVGSSEHKAARWWNGLPGARLNPDGEVERPKKELTTICHKVTIEDRDTATNWVREALRNRQLKFFEGCKTYPKHIWYRDQDGQFWFGFAVNAIAGTYKGWPISEEEKRAVFD